MEILNCLWKHLHSVPDYSQHFAAELQSFLSHFIILAALVHIEGLAVAL